MYGNVFKCMTSNLKMFGAWKCIVWPVKRKGEASNKVAKRRCSLLRIRDSLTMHIVIKTNFARPFRSKCSGTFPFRHPSYSKHGSSYSNITHLNAKKYEKFCTNNLNHINHHDWYGMICENEMDNNLSKKSFLHAKLFRNIIFIAR